MAEKKVTITQAKALNASLRQLLDTSEEAVDRLAGSGATDFVCSNYKQAVISFSFLVKYVRDFAGVG